MVQIGEVGHLRVAELSKIRGTGDARKGILPRGGGGLVIAVRINARQPFAHEIVGIVQFAVDSNAVVVALGEQHALGTGKGAAVWSIITLIQTGEGRIWVAENVVELKMVRHVEQAHSASEIFLESWRFAQMLAKKQGIVP